MTHTPAEPSSPLNADPDSHATAMLRARCADDACTNAEVRNCHLRAQTEMSHTTHTHKRQGMPLIGDRGRPALLRARES